MMTTDTPPEIWRIRLTADTVTAKGYAEALEAFCPTVSWVDTYEEGVVEVEGILEEEPNRAAVMAALMAAHQPVPPVEIELLPPLDWLQMSYQSFPPKTLGRYWIHGSHIQERHPAGLWPLMIDAATAFGSGEHPTTAGCLGAIERIYKRQKFVNVLDMGTGSGILAIAAVRAGRSRMTAIDIDPESIRVTRNHARGNKILPHFRLQAGAGYKTPLVHQNAPYDLILCNILARPLCQMSAEAGRVIKQGGTIILAGLLNTQARMVINAYRRQGFALVKQVKKEEWSILEMRKGAAA